MLSERASSRGVAGRATVRPASWSSPAGTENYIKSRLCDYFVTVGSGGSRALTLAFCAPRIGLPHLTPLAQKRGIAPERLEQGMETRSRAGSPAANRTTLQPVVTPAWPRERWCADGREGTGLAVGSVICAS